MQTAPVHRWRRVVTERRSRAATIPTRNAPPAFNYDDIQAAVRRQIWPPTVFIWQPMHCGSNACSLGWSDGTEWGNYLTTCTLFRGPSEDEITCTTLLMR
jgi:hypothetical protein